MDKRTITKEFQKLKSEIFVNKPKIDGPFPTSIVRKREFLLFAQVWLDKILDTKTENNIFAEKFNTEIYNVILSHYYAN
jgi:hypothetical protein